MKSVLDFLKAKNKRQIKMLTCYDSWSAQIIADSSIDAVLVGDSVSMVLHGQEDTLSADTDLIALHTRAVSRKLSGKKFIVGDLPFLSYRKSLTESMNAVEKIMKAGAHAVKLEGLKGHEEHIRHMVDSGVPVMGHIGLTPQSINTLGGFRVQGKSKEQAEHLVREAQALQELGCFSIVLECVPRGLAQEISALLEIPTIGIGAGAHCDGQILVLQDMLGLNGDFQPKFLKKYLEGSTLIKEALHEYCREVDEGIFPSEKESYEYGKN